MAAPSPQLGSTPGPGHGGLELCGQAEQEVFAAHACDQLHADGETGIGLAEGEGDGGLAEVVDALGGVPPSTAVR